MKVPLSTSSWHRRSYSSADPSHHSTVSGSVSAAISSTHAISFLLVVGGMGWMVLLGIPVGHKRRTVPSRGLSTGYPPIVVVILPLNARQ